MISEKGCPLTIAIRARATGRIKSKIVASLRVNIIARSYLAIVQSYYGSSYGSYVGVGAWCLRYDWVTVTAVTAPWCV